jgi:hypothetical protein
VCRFNYTEYEEHTITDLHVRNLRRNQFQRLIVETAKGMERYWASRAEG